MAASLVDPSLVARTDVPSRTAGDAGEIDVAFLAPPTIPLLCNPYILGDDTFYTETTAQQCIDRGRVQLKDVAKEYQNLRCSLPAPPDPKSPEYRAISGKCFAMRTPMMQDTHNFLLAASEASRVRLLHICPSLVMSRLCDHTGCCGAHVQQRDWDRGVSCPAVLVRARSVLHRQLRTCQST